MCYFYDWYVVIPIFVFFLNTHILFVIVFKGPQPADKIQFLECHAPTHLLKSREDLWRMVLYLSLRALYYCC